MWRSSGLRSLRNNEDFASDKSQFDALRAELDQLVKDFQRDQAAMSEEDQVAARQKMASKQSDLEYVAKKLQTLQTQNAQRVMQELAPQAQEVLREIIETEQIGLSAAAAGGHSRRSGLQHHGESLGQDESNGRGVSAHAVPRGARASGARAPGDPARHPAVWRTWMSATADDLSFRFGKKTSWQSSDTRRAR